MAIKGHRVGDNFAFSGCNDEIILGVIRQVRCKELKLLHEILEHVRIRPDNESMIHAIPADIPALLVKLNEYARDNARIMSVYRERKWPLVWLAAACNRPAFDVFWAALNGQVGPLDAFPGNIHFYEKHSSIAASDTPFLLDLHALQTISCFDLMPILQLIRNRCRICQSAVDALTSAIQAIKLSQHSEQSISGDGIGGATLYTVPESERVRYRHHLSACDSFIQSLSYSQILPEPTRRELPEAAPAVLSFPIADMIEISREQSIPVLLGDMRLSGLFHPDFQFSVRAVIDLARRKNVLTAERTAAVLGEMKLAGLQYISVSEDILIASRDLLIGGQKPEAFAILFSQLSPVKSDWKTSLPIIANCISTFAITRGLDDNQRQTLVAAVLSAAFGESHQGKHLRDLVALVRAHLRLAPIQLAATLETVRIWNSMHKNSIIT